MVITFARLLRYLSLNFGDGIVADNSAIGVLLVSLYYIVTIFMQLSLFVFRLIVTSPSDCIGCTWVIRKLLL